MVRFKKGMRILGLSSAMLTFSTVAGAPLEETIHKNTTYFIKEFKPLLDDNNFIVKSNSLSTEDLLLGEFLIDYYLKTGDSSPLVEYADGISNKDKKNASIIYYLLTWTSKYENYMSNIENLLPVLPYEDVEQVDKQFNVIRSQLDTTSLSKLEDPSFIERTNSIIIEYLYMLSEKTNDSMYFNIAVPFIEKYSGNEFIKLCKRFIPTIKDPNQLSYLTRLVMDEYFDLYTSSSLDSIEYYINEEDKFLEMVGEYHYSIDSTSHGMYVDMDGFKYSYYFLIILHNFSKDMTNENLDYVKRIIDKMVSHENHNNFDNPLSKEIEYRLLDLKYMYEEINYYSAHREESIGRGMEGMLSRKKDIFDSFSMFSYLAYFAAQSYAKHGKMSTAGELAIMSAKYINIAGEVTPIAERLDSLNQKPSLKEIVAFANNNVSTDYDLDSWSVPDYFTLSKLNFLFDDYDNSMKFLKLSIKHKNNIGLGFTSHDISEFKSNLYSSGLDDQNKKLFLELLNQLNQ
ncbi:hypothetical protein J7J90_03205 [Candidatus Micrarchaeota archaeon]|nr:hypothetical protein [Candidatus Micrarchaeota archaeon]